MRKLLVMTVVTLCILVVWTAGCRDDDTDTETSMSAGVSTTGPGSTSEEVTATSSSVSTEPGSTTDATSTGGPGATTIPVFSDYGLWEDTIKYVNGDKEIDLSLTVSIPEDFADAGGMSAPKENKLVGVWVRIDYMGGSSIKISPRWFTMNDTDGNVHESITVTGSDHQVMESVELEPGKTAEGYVFFEVPEDMAVVSVTCDVSEGQDPGAPRTWSD
ncbi:MAG: DUF4352 domain-containing protein [Actinobacteria bacterium]|nr:DUF4352 domain-containing protein [Actinomycetota bacterium]